MKLTERAVIYSALIVLGAVNAVFLLSQSGRTAFAEAAAWLQNLGPAESLTLVDGSDELVVRNKSGRMAWGSGDFKQSYSVGFVDIGKALNPLMESSAFVEERENLRSELETAEKSFQTRLEALGEELRGLEQNSPAFRERYEEANKIYQEYEQWSRNVALKRRDELDVKHLQQAYKEMSSAVNVVADKLGIDIVLRFIPTDRDFTSMNAEQALTEIRLRSAVKYPERLDITSEVLEELSLQVQDR